MGELSEVQGLVTDRVEASLPPVRWYPQGLWSLDRAVGFLRHGHLGWPGRSLIELYGDEHTGKTTLAYFIAGWFCRDRTLWVADLEKTLNVEYVEFVTRVAGHTGKIKVADYATGVKKKKPRSDEIQIEEAIDALLDPDVGAGIIDSIGMFTSIVQESKHVGERTVGQEAKTINDATKRLSNRLLLAEDDKLFFYINHTSPRIGAGGGGFTTPGGRKKYYAANLRLWIRRKESDWPKGSGGFVSEVVVQKNKYGGNKGAKAWVYFIPGYGVSKELTAVYECKMTKMAKFGNTVKLYMRDPKDHEFKWMSQGRISTLARWALEPAKHRAVFQRFQDALGGDVPEDADEDESVS